MCVCVCVCVCVSVSVSLMEDVVSVPLEESPHWEKMSKLELFSVITQIYRWLDCTLELRTIERSGLPPNLVTPGIKRSHKCREEATRN